MLQIIGFALLFFLPVTESFNRQLGFDLLLLGSLLVSAKMLIRGKIRIDLINALWLMLLVIFSISSGHTLSWPRSYFEYLRYISYFLIFVSIRSAGNTQKVFKYFFVPMVIVNSLSLSFLTVLYSLPDLKLRPLHTMTLFYPEFGHNHLIDILIFAIPITIVKFINSYNRIKKTLWFILSLIFTFFSIFSFGRAAMIGLSLSFFIYIFIVDKSRKLYWWAIIFGLLSIFLLFLIFYVSNFKGPVRNEFRIIRNLYRPFIADFHVKNNYQAMVAWWRNPVFGTGLNTFKLLALRIPPINRDWYAHNHYLEILAETGIFGTAIFLALIVSTLIYSLQRVKTKFDMDRFPLHGGLLISILASTIQSIFDYQWHFVSIFLLYFMGLAFLTNKPEIATWTITAMWRLFILVIACLFLVALLSLFNNFKMMY